MSSDRIGTMPDEVLKAALAKIMRDSYVLAGSEPQLIFEQMDDLVHDIKTGHQRLTLNEIRLACKAGISGELGGPKKPSYAAVMQWCEAYDKCAMVADVRGYINTRPKEIPTITEEQGLRMMAKTMPDCAWKRWEDIRTIGKFGLSIIPHVSAQIYDWLGEEGFLRLSTAEREEAAARARKEVPKTSVWDTSNLEGEKVRVRNRAKHYALETWMRNQYASGKGLTLPKEIKRIYQ